MDDLREKLIEYLENNDLDYTEKENKVIHMCLNPDHIEAHPSSFTSFTDEVPFSHCSSCKFHLDTENLYKFLELGVDHDLLFKNIINKMLKDGDIKIQDSVKVYLPLKEGTFEKEYRMISPEVFKEVGAYYTMADNYYGKRIIIPMRDVNNNLISFEAISTNKERQPKVLRPKSVDTSKLFGFENLIKSDTVFIVEGIFNALSFKTVGFDSVFNFGVATIKNKIRTLMSLGIKNVVLAGDNDEVGKKFNVDMYHILKHNFNVMYFNYPWKSPDKFDPNDLHKQLGSEKFKEYVDNILNKNMIKINKKD